MKLHDCLDETMIDLGVQSGSKEELFQRLADKFVMSGEEKIPFSSDEIVAKLLERENTLSTGLGNGIALPHARIEKITSVNLVIGTIKPSVEYDAIDQKPVDIFACLLIPVSEPAKGLKMMAQLARFFAEEGDFFRNAKSAMDVLSKISELDLMIEEPILARDIMIDPPYVALASTPLKEISLKMAEFRVNSVPVVDDDNCLLGQISCNHLFNIGVPDFFRSLKSVSFVSYFDPFAEYFKQESGATAEDVMQNVMAPLSPDSSMLEIIFDLTVKNRQVLYVVNDKKLLGTIDPATVMNRVINY